MPKPQQSPDLDALLAVTSLLDKVNQDHADDPSYQPPQSAEMPEPAPTSPPVPVKASARRPAQPPQAPAPAVAIVAPPKTPTPTAPAKLPEMKRIVFTGSMCVGKDHVATSLGSVVLGFADPIYALVPLFFGRACNKAEPGVREFLQKVGQWGRGEVNEQYPLTTERASFCRMVRMLGFDLTADLSDHAELLKTVDWPQFGLQADLWIDSALKRSVREDRRRVAITNARFPNELKRLRDTEGWSHWHVMCSPKTWGERLAKQGLSTASPRVNDMSEQLAQKLNAAVLQAAKQPGGKMQVVWNDTVPQPSNRFFSLSELVSKLNPV